MKVYINIYILLFNNKYNQNKFSHTVVIILIKNGLKTNY